MICPDLTQLASRFERPPLTRFAPSPTGYLHLGHVVNAIYVWGIAKALGGRVLLRLEDHDRVRSRKEFEQALLQDLDWLGFVPDAGRDPVIRQSDHPHEYARALQTLQRSSIVYGCDCSRKSIGSDRYDGRCRARNLGMSDTGGVRVVMEHRVERIDDALLGELVQVPAEQCGDLLVRDRDGHWTYQFAATVDDMRQQITLVIRGADLVSSTGRQVALARMLGRSTPPVFLHHPLILKANGEKLSKSSNDTGVRELRRAGATPEDVLGRAAFAVGLLRSERPISAAVVADLFRRRDLHGTGGAR